MIYAIVKKSSHEYNAIEVLFKQNSKHFERYILKSFLESMQ